MQEDDRRQDSVKGTELTKGSRKDLVSKPFPHKHRKGNGKGSSVLLKMCQNQVRTYLTDGTFCLSEPNHRKSHRGQRNELI